MQHQIDPFELISLRVPFSAASELGVENVGLELNVRDEFERGLIPGLILAEEDAPYVEAAQTFSFAFDSDLLDPRARP